MNAFNWKGQPSQLGQDKGMKPHPKTGLCNSTAASLAAETYRKRTGKSLGGLGDLSAKGSTNPYAKKTGAK